MAEDTLRPAPYPADVRAKGWRFELDMERVIQSDTWDLAAEIPMAQHALLMMWVTAWQQVPCGSMPADPALIRAKLKVPPTLWEPMRDVVLRGWTRHDDGRLYHPTITERVLGMLGAKEGERKRKADYRARMAAQRQPGSSADDDRPTPTEHHGSPDLSHGTVAGRTVESAGRDDTGTGTGTGIEIQKNHRASSSRGVPAAPSGSTLDPPAQNASAAQPTAVGRICLLLRRAGVSTVNHSSPRLQALIDAGATADEFLAHVPRALEVATDPFAYVLRAVEGERTRAADMVKHLHQGAMPPQPQDRKSRQLATAAVLTGVAPKFIPPEAIDVDARIIPS